MGELRRKRHGRKERHDRSNLGALGHMIGSSFQFGTPLWMALLLAPVCMVSEWPRLRYIDDNATMVLIPLALILILEPFAGVMV